MNHCAYCQKEDTCKDSTTHQWCTKWTRRDMEPRKPEVKSNIPIGAITINPIEHLSPEQNYFGTEKIVLPEHEESVWDTQVGGGHYKDMGIQPTVYIMKNKMPFADGCVIKYVSRHRFKNGKEDIEKAIHYLQMILEEEY